MEQENAGDDKIRVFFQEIHTVVDLELFLSGIWKNFLAEFHLSEEALSVRKKSCVPPSIGGDFFR